jgi:hypothetical protein
MCDCEKNLTEKFLTKFKADCPEAIDHEVILTGYAILFSGSVNGFMPVNQTAKFPLKKNGVMKEKKIKTNLLFTYCPFCGKKYKEG